MKLRFTFLLILLLGVVHNAFPKSVSIKKVWVTKTDKGFYVHSHINASGFKKEKIMVVAAFYDSNKKRMNGVKQGYLNTANHASAYKVEIPQKDSIVYNDYKIYVPIEALNLKNGKNTCYVSVSVYDIKQKTYIGSPSGYTSFTVYKNADIISTNNTKKSYHLLDGLGLNLKNNNASNSYHLNKNTSNLKNNNLKAFSGKVTKLFYYVPTGVKSYFTIEGSICYESDEKGNRNHLREIYGKYENTYVYRETINGYGIYYSQHPKYKNIWKKLSIAEDFSSLYVYNSVTGRTNEYINKIDKSKITKQPSNNFAPVINYGPLFETTKKSYDDNYIPCPACNGSGNCPSCAGRGWRKWTADSPVTECTSCNGGGKCNICFGTKKIRAD